MWISLVLVAAAHVRSDERRPQRFALGSTCELQKLNGAVCEESTFGMLPVIGVVAREEWKTSRRCHIVEAATNRSGQHAGALILPSEPPASAKATEEQGTRSLGFPSAGTTQICICRCFSSSDAKRAKLLFAKPASTTAAAFATLAVSWPSRSVSGLSAAESQQFVHATGVPVAGRQLFKILSIVSIVCLELSRLPWCNHYLDYKVRMPPKRP